MTGLRKAMLMSGIPENLFLAWYIHVLANKDTNSNGIRPDMFKIGTANGTKFAISTKQKTLVTALVG